MKYKFIYIVLIIVSSQIFSQHEVYDLLSIKFIDNFNGVTVGGTFDQGLILHTKDSGESWCRFGNFDGRSIRKAEYFNDESMMLFTFDSLYIHTNNDYKVLSYPNEFFFLDAYFLDKYVGWISGSGGALYLTLDGGNTWNKQNINSSSAGIGSLFFLNRNNGWCSNGNNIFITKDGGANWMITENTSSTLSISFIDSLTGYRIDPQFAYKSEDGGKNWKILNVSSYKNFEAIYTKSYEESFIIADSYGEASVFRTTDSGKVWTEYVLENINRISPRDITFSDSLTGWISCNNGIIYKTNNGGDDWYELNSGITNVNENPNKINEYRLFNNFPNPFNPSTKIKYSLAQNSHVQITIYNIHGEEIERLVDEKMKAGIHELEFRGEYLPSGIYFYRIVCAKYSETKKMMLIK